MIKFAFNQIKTTQAAGYLLSRANGSMSKGILVKMLYLTDRALLGLRGQPLTGDQPVSMKNGPVLSNTYDFMKGAGGAHDAWYWGEFITGAPKGQTWLGLKKTPELTRLSKSEIQVLEKTFVEFKDYTWDEIVGFCHELPEWTEPGNSSRPIRIEQILMALGKGEEEILEIEAQLQESLLMDSILPNQVPA